MLDVILADAEKVLTILQEGYLGSEMQIKIILNYFVNYFMLTFLQGISG